MFQRWTIRLIFACLVTSISLQAQEMHIGTHDIQVHGFATQGFVHTDDNNWLTMNTSSVGSGAFTDAGVNVGSQITSRLRVGGQVYDRKLGQLGDWHPELDWAIADVRFQSWLSFRGGKVKTVLGLFTDSQDMDFANTFALLPQSIYPIDLRDSTIAHLGGDLYGKAKLPHQLGTLAYTAYGGRRSDSIHSGYPYLLTGYGIFLKKYGGPVYGADLRWRAPLRGLTLGASRLNERITGTGTVLQGGRSLPYEEHSKQDWTNQFYGQYTGNKFHLESEYKRYLHDQIIFSGAFAAETDVRGWYTSGAYRLTNWLEAGAYYSHYRIFPYGVAPTVPDSQLHDYDKAITAKFSPNRIMTIKVEGHFMNGNGSEEYPDGFYANVNPKGFVPNTTAVVIRTGFSY